MFSVVGLTLNQISSGSLPQIQLADTLDVRAKEIGSRHGASRQIVIYSTDATDTQALIARTKYRQKGQFLVFLYFNDVAVEACTELGIPLNILDRIEERELPSRRNVVLERPYLAPIANPRR